jgi:hypothetical protein
MADDRLMTDIDRAAMRARAEAATEGPWDYVCQGVVAQFTQSSEDAMDNPVATGRTDADGEFVAHARTDIPALLAALEDAERERDELLVTMTELRPDPVLVEGSFIPVAEWPTILGNFMRSSDEYAREAKAMFIRAEDAERGRDEAKAEALEEAARLIQLQRVLRGKNGEWWAGSDSAEQLVAARAAKYRNATESKGN